MAIINKVGIAVLAFFLISVGFVYAIQKKDVKDRGVSSVSMITDWGGYSRTGGRHLSISGLVSLDQSEDQDQGR